MTNKTEITEIVEKELAKALTDLESEKNAMPETEHKSAKNLRKIGKYIVDRREMGEKVPRNIDKTTKKAYDDAVSYIDSNEKDMEKSNDDQKRIYTQVKDNLIKVRSSNSYEELETRRKNLEFLKKLNSDSVQDTNNLGEVNAKNYIEKLINKIHTESKPSKTVKVLGMVGKGLFSQEGTALGSVINEFKFIGDMLKVAVPKLSKPSESSFEANDAEISRLSKAETVYKKQSKSFRDIDPGIVPKKAAPGIVTPPPDKEPIKIGGQKIYPDDPMYAKIMGESKIPPASPAESVKVSSKDTKTATLTVDKLIAKSIVLDKPLQTTKPHIKLKSGSSVENKPFKTELLGEEPATGTPQSDSSSIIDTIKDAFLGSVLGKKIAGAGGVGGIAKTVAKSKVGSTLLAGGAMLTGGAALDTGLGALGVGKDTSGNDLQLNEQQDTANWEKMSTWEKIQSGAARGIEKAGKFVFLDNMANQAASERIAKETEHLKDRVSTKPTMIEKSAQEIPKVTESIEKKARELGAQPVIISPPAQAPIEQQAPTIVPIRGSIRSNESAFNRFQDKTFRA